MWGDRNGQSLLVGMPHGAATVGASLAISYKTKHSLNHAIWQSDFQVFTQMH